MSNDLTFTDINATVNKGVQAKETDIKTQISELGENPTTQDLLMLQQNVTQWTLMTQIQSTLVKEMGDAMKGVVQKSG